MVNVPPNKVPGDAVGIFSWDFTDILGSYAPLVPTENPGYKPLIVLCFVCFRFVYKLVQVYANCEKIKNRAVKKGIAV